MKNLFTRLSLLLLLHCSLSFGQTDSIDKVKFFEDTSIVNVTITTDMNELFRHRNRDNQIPALLSMTMPDDKVSTEHIMLALRGHSRRDICYIPPLKVMFNYSDTSEMSSLGSLKLVNECKTAGADQQYLLKEFLIYKIYNLITPYSFRVRLLNLNLVDSSGKKKPLNEYAFLMEDFKNLAKRNGCKEIKTIQLPTEATDRRQMTIVAIFEYMIGNTDWGVPVNHNTKLLFSRTDSTKRPYVVPYDFDYSGFVNTDYAVPDERLGIDNVTVRLYRGFPRTMEELNDVLSIFKAEKDSIYALIDNFNLLTQKSKQQITDYLDDFYKTINNPNEINDIFVKASNPG
jgi:hypothetical protein